MSSTILQVELLIATALDLAQKAKSDPALAEKLLKDPTATISQKAGVPMPAGVTIKTKRAADGSIQLTPDAPASERTNMNKLIAYGELVRYARGLIVAARKDPKLAAEISKNPSQAVANAAGYPVPEGIVVKAGKDANGNFDLSVSVDPAFQGELDDVLLENVAGGKGGHSSPPPPPPPPQQQQGTPMHKDPNTHQWVPNHP